MRKRLIFVLFFFFSLLFSLLGNSARSEIEVKGIEDLELRGISGYFDVIGRRAQVIGDERSIEFWSFPLELLRDYTPNINFSELTKRPWSVIRNGGGIEEEIFVPRDEEGVVIIYSSDFPQRVEVDFTPVLEYSWPLYSPPDISQIRITFEANRFILEKGREKVIIGGEGIKRTGVTSFCFDLGLTPQVIRIATNEKTYKTLANWKQLYEEATDSYQDFLDHVTIIETPDEQLNRDYLWNLFALDNCYIEKPEKGWVAGFDKSENITEWGGRPGYAWYYGRDFFWMSFAITSYGDFERVKEGFKLLQKFQRVDGKIMHEIPTSIHQVGRENWEENHPWYFWEADSTPLYLITLDYYFKCSNDTEFIKQSKESIVKAFNYLIKTDYDGDALIDNKEGPGWVEGGFLAKDQIREGHTTLYLASLWLEALGSAEELFEFLGEARLSKKCEELSGKINLEQFWSAEGYFYHRKLPDGSFGRERTVMGAIPLLFGQVNEQIALEELKLLNSKQITTPWGCRIVSNLDKSYNETGYHEGTVWPLFTGWSALANYRYGDYPNGYSLTLKNLLLVEDWGLGYTQEVIHGDRYEPIGYAHQGWSSAMALLPALKGVAGIEVNERNKTIIWSPYLSQSWNFLKVKNIRSGDSFFNLTILRNETGISIDTEGDTENYTIILKPVIQANPIAEDTEFFKIKILE
jgi:glycogen debranching enzyme